MERVVSIRSEIDGADSRFLRAYMTNSHLTIEGQDLGPRTAVVSNDGEYEWFRTVRSADIPSLVAALGGTLREDVLDVLERVATPNHGYELERLLREGIVPCELYVV